jgi:hypothetical protein
MPGIWLRARPWSAIDEIDVATQRRRHVKVR